MANNYDNTDVVIHKHKHNHKYEEKESGMEPVNVFASQPTMPYGDGFGLGGGGGLLGGLLVGSLLRGGFGGWGGNGGWSGAGFKSNKPERFSR